MRPRISIVMLLSWITLAAQEFNWVHPAAGDTQTIFYQGMLSSQTQAAKYTGKQGFIATTGERVVNEKGITTIGSIHITPEIDEIVLGSKHPYRWSDITFNPIEMFQTLCTRLCYSATERSQRSYGTKIVDTGNQNSDVTIAWYSLNVGKINIAQDGDLANYTRRFEACIESHPDDTLIAYGVSRGAATTFQALARFAQEGKDISKIKLCILEGCFDDVPSVMRKRHPYLLRSDWALHMLAAAASTCISFNIAGPSPLAAVDQFPQSVPVAFITSRADLEVPAECTKRLIGKLYESGHRNIYLLELEKSSHSGYMFDDADDARKYQSFVHALYERYNLPYNAEYAQQGRSLLVAYSPEKE